MTQVLLLESARANGTSFSHHLTKRYEVVIKHSGKEALHWLSDQRPDVLVLDAASMRTSGDRLCSHLRQSVSVQVPIIHIRPEPLEKSDTADIVLAPPLTYRKLMNRIERCLHAQQGEILQVGPFMLNVDQALLTTPKGSEKLTPRLAKLVEIFMRHPNEVVERKMLMKDVWQTDYMGDTRTLDVHIRWMRQAIESDASSPLYLRTVRGKGYILSVDPQGTRLEAAKSPKPPL